jgi:two-component system sensor histidine kinase BarA
MSYRSIKRVLGETLLELKLLFLFGGCALVLTLGSFWFYGSQTEKLVYQQNRNKGRLLVDTIKLKVHWKADATPRPAGGAAPNDVRDPEQFINLLTGGFQAEKYEWSFIRPHSADGRGKPKTEAEVEVLNYFLNQPRHDPESNDVEFVEYTFPDESKYHYYEAVRAKRVCVDCHRAVLQQEHLSEGDLMSIIKVEISDAPVQADIAWNNAILWATAIFTSFLLVVASYFIIRYVVVKPLKHLQEVSDAISHGELDKRAEIHTGDEFEAVGVAFNRMVRHLVAVQEELRQLNAEMDAKVDQLAQKNVQLYEMNRMKSDFLATMSHELRTPLNSIIGFSDVLASIDTLNEKQKRYVQNIQKSGRVLLDMINDILDLAKIEAGKMEIRLTDFRIDHVVHAQCDMARPLTERKNIDLEVDIQPGLPPLHQDQGKVQQILNNLLSNAIKFTPEGGRICIRARQDARGDLNLVVSDTGIGIAEEDQARIFEKFRQGDAAVPSGDPMTREYSGTGLGLSIVKELCKLLGGEISLESQLGKGSTFTVRLPWSLPDRPKREPELPTPALEALLASRRADLTPRTVPTSAATD